MLGYLDTGLLPTPDCLRLLPDLVLPVFASLGPDVCCFRLRYSLMESFRFGVGGGSGAAKLGLSRGSLLCVRVTILGQVVDTGDIDCGLGVVVAGTMAGASMVEYDGMATLNMECVGMGGGNDWLANADSLLGFSRYSDSTELPATTAGSCEITSGNWLKNEVLVGLGAGSGGGGGGGSAAASEADVSKSGSQVMVAGEDGNMGGGGGGWAILKATAGTASVFV